MVYNYKGIGVKMKNIAITGATGLLGSHLSNHYLLLGYNVFVLLKDEHSRTELSKDVNRVYGSINNKVLISNIKKSYLLESKYSVIIFDLNFIIYYSIIYIINYSKFFY